MGNHSFHSQLHWFTLSQLDPIKKILHMKVLLVLKHCYAKACPFKRAVQEPRRFALVKLCCGAVPDGVGAVGRVPRSSHHYSPVLSDAWEWPVDAVEWLIDVEG